MVLAHFLAEVATREVMARDYRCAQAGVQETRENGPGDIRVASASLWYQLRL
jgi:hypothetical protein